MIARIIQSRSEKRLFYKLPFEIYKGNPNFRATEESITRLLIEGPTQFHKHASVFPCLLESETKTVGRFAFFHDKRLPIYLQVGFFEAFPGLENVLDAIMILGKSLNTSATKILVGLNGHLNYGAGILLDRFDLPPVFGLPYSLPCYADYFKSLSCCKMVSFRFPLSGIYNWCRQTEKSFDSRGITVRYFDKHTISREIDIYTRIDNASFSACKTPFWSNRDPEENYELFYPFRHLLRKEHLVFAEAGGKPIGFLLWYPDFNGLVSSNKEIGIKEFLHYRIDNPLRVVRLAEVAVLPEYRNSTAVAAMYLKSLPKLEASGYKTCEGGFIFRENIRSITMTQRFIERGQGIQGQPFREYGIFEGNL